MGRDHRFRLETKFSGANGDRNMIFPCSADRVQDWQPYSVDPSILLLYVIIHMYEDKVMRHLTSNGTYQSMYIDYLYSIQEIFLFVFTLFPAPILLYNSIGPAVVQYL